MLASHRQTPWRHDSELALVRDWFFPQYVAHSSDPYNIAQKDDFHDLRQRAVQKVNLWIFKAGRIQHAITATAWLTEARIFDELRSKSEGPVLSFVFGEGILKSVYAMAFVRFVNGFVDRDVVRQAKSGQSVLLNEAGKDGGKNQVMSKSDTSRTKVPGVGESSMYAYAATIGMPEVFVSLRHQVTHGEMPNLGYLREMNEHGLEWLWENWWSGDRNIKETKHRAERDIEWRRFLGQNRQEVREETLGSRSVSDEINDDQQQPVNGKTQDMEELEHHTKADKRKRDVSDDKEGVRRSGKRSI